MDVPFFDLKAQYRTIREEVREALERVCEKSAFILGEEVEQFEREFASFCGAKHCVALNSGTSALHLSLLALRVQPGDEVITTSNTFIATAEAISYVGATPIFADINPCTGNLDPRCIEAAISQRTRAILPVHLYGRPVEMEPILALARSRGLCVVEDACQAHGAKYHGRPVGSLGDAAAFSFYPSKNLGAYGEGGALTTNDDEIAQFARAARTHGQSKRYVHDFIGYNYRMDGFQAAVLRVKMKHLAEWTRKRKKYAQLYREILQDARLELPRDDPASESVYHLFAVYADNRDAVRSSLERAGIQTAVHYPLPVHLQTPYAAPSCPPGHLPHTERACARVLCLPLYPEMGLNQVQYAGEKLREIVGRR